MNNPFRYPETVDSEVNSEIKELITHAIKNGLKFHDMVAYYEKYVTDGDKTRAEISGYYCVNAVISSKLDPVEKQNIIDGMCREFIEKFN